MDQFSMRRFWHTHAHLAREKSVSQGGRGTPQVTYEAILVANMMA